MFRLHRLDFRIFCFGTFSALATNKFRLLFVLKSNLFTSLTPHARAITLMRSLLAKKKSPIVWQILRFRLLSIHELQQFFWIFRFRAGGRLYRFLHPGLLQNERPVL